MENNDLIRRAQDLAERCDKSCSVTSTFFLSPAEQFGILSWARRFPPECSIVFEGGRPECERKAAFFLPYYVNPEELDIDERISVIRATAGFGMPGHRDYMGAILALGIKREWIGDIWVNESTAYIFCMPTVERLLLDGLCKVGRFGVKTAKIALSEVVAPERRVFKTTFSVMSPRLDAIVGGMFNVSRTEAARLIGSGAVSLNYAECVKTDTTVKEGDVLSLRGRGKGEITGFGGQSRRGRLFVNAEIYL